MPPRRHRFSSSTTDDDGAKMVVRNTFLELVPDDPLEEVIQGHRPRSKTDTLDRTSNPRKSSFTFKASSRPTSAGRSGGAAAAFPPMPPPFGFAGLPPVLPPFATAPGLENYDPYFNPHGIPPMMMPPAGVPSPYADWDSSWLYPPEWPAGPYGYPPSRGRAAHQSSGKAQGKPEKKKAQNNRKVQFEGSENNQSTKAAKKSKEPAGPTVPPPLPVNGTTVMLRNIPNRYRQSTILSLIDEHGFEKCYDFVYLPIDFRNGVNLGYAFVNMVMHEEALRFMTVFQGFNGWSFDSVKVCEVSWAHPHQGLDEHVERYRHSPVMHPSTPDEYKPMVFTDGVRQPFPAPRQAIKAPKLKSTVAPLDGSPQKVPVPTSS